MTGQIGGALGLTLVGTGTNIGARLMANARFVKWLAAATEKPVGALPAEINVLKRVATENKDPEIAEAADILSQSAGQPESEPN